MFVIAAFYHFSIVEDTVLLQKHLENLCTSLHILGILLVAPEGINGTVAGKKHKESLSETIPFHRMSVKVKRELITMKRPEANPCLCKGIYVEPKDWNNLLRDPDVLLIDTRNDYEINLGSFKNAINPETKSFSEFPDYVENNLLSSKQKKIAMYCTGGIRCEKASSYMLQEGFHQVYHLKGGILKYLEEIPEQDSLWEGNCYVFDQRVSVGHGLVIGGEKICYACRSPLHSDDQQDEFYEEGVQCKYCYHNLSDEVKRANRERQDQIRLAERRHEKHIGMTEENIHSKRKYKKQSL